jgi:hypothetical protein
MSHLFGRIFVLSVAVVLLAGCETKANNNCPGVSTLVETSVATVFKAGASSDPSNILYTVEIAGVHSTCDADKLAVSASTNLTIDFHASRGLGVGAARYKIPYFVAISQADRVLAKREFVADFGFEPGQTSATFSALVNDANVIAAKDKKAFDYVILVGLQLSKAQLQFNRAGGRLTP